MNNSFYSPEIWERFVKKFGSNERDFALKTYPQLDPYFNFFHRKDEIHDLVKDPTLKKVKEHAFLPFVKILTKTPRYRYQENEKSYGLETKVRPIAFASHFDSYLYAYYSFVLTQKYETYIRENKFDSCVLAYRTDLNGKCNIQFAKEVFDNVTNRLSEEKTCVAIAYDITGYFDNIDHRILKEKWCKLLSVDELPIDQYKVYRSITKYNYVNKDSILRHFNVDLKEKNKRKEKWQSLLDLIPDSANGSRFGNKFDLLREKKLIVTNRPKRRMDGSLTYKGIPQGSPISALLSNIYLIDFDEWLYKLSLEMNFTYKRYCDDLIVICKDGDEVFITSQILEEINRYELTIQDRKTELLYFSLNSRGKYRCFNKKKILVDQISLDSKNEQRYYKNLQYLGFEFNGQHSYIRPGSLSRYFKKLKGRIDKTVLMAYSRNSKADFIFKKQIINKYSHFGARNFITYAQNASKDFYRNSRGVVRRGMNSIGIKRQLASHYRILEKEILNASIVRAAQKSSNTNNLKVKM